MNERKNKVAHVSEYLREVVEEIRTPQEQPTADHEEVTEEPTPT
jgi:hypothetical protein